MLDLVQRLYIKAKRVVETHDDIKFESDDCRIRRNLSDDIDELRWITHFEFSEDVLDYLGLFYNDNGELEVSESHKTLIAR